MHELPFGGAKRTLPRRIRPYGSESKVSIAANSTSKVPREASRNLQPWPRVLILGTRGDRIPDHVTKRGGLDRTRINMSEEREARYVSKQELAEAVTKVGNFAEAVRP